jgi:glycosyltransferase involved in cell wall biosynthesis
MWSSPVRKGHYRLAGPSVGSVIDIVLPCLNEAAALPWVLSRIPSGARALIVDNGSTDGSTRIAAALGAVVVVCRRRGYGAACQAGLLASEAELVAFCDCDGTLDPWQVTRLAQPVLALDAELVVARRVPVRGAGWPLHARLANYELARRVRRRTGLALRDIGPMRVAHRAALLELPIHDSRSGYPVETVLRAAEAGWRVLQRDVPYLPRTGHSKITGTVSGTLIAIRDTRAVLAT